MTTIDLQVEPQSPDVTRPSRAEAEAAIRTVIRWAGDDPERRGLQKTPARVVRVLEEFYSGYAQDPALILKKSITHTDAYKEMVVLRGVSFGSHCEHHMEPITGRAWVAYIPQGKLVGISKLARVVEAFAKRLQTQERMTTQIAETINAAIEPRGVGVVVRASHHCMTGRGVSKADVDLVTNCMLGCFQEDAAIRREFLSSLSDPA